ERLPLSLEKVNFLAERPFRFTLEDAGDGTTRVDWNHNGVFDEKPVEADINYGYSTHAGDRKTHELIGAAPSLAYVSQTCLLATSAHKQNGLSIKSYSGDAKWGDAIKVPESQTRFDPVLIGGTEEGLLLFRRSTKWRAATVKVVD